VRLGVLLGVAVAVGVRVGLFVGVRVGLFVGVRVAVLVAVRVGVEVGVLVGVLVRVEVCVRVGVGRPKRRTATCAGEPVSQTTVIPFESAEEAELVWSPDVVVLTLNSFSTLILKK
jgi:hypothetical protein